MKYFSFVPGALATLLAVAPVAVKSHATQVRYCTLKNDFKVRIFVEHWHGDDDLSESKADATSAGTMSFVNNGIPEDRTPTGFIYNTPVESLGDEGGCDDSSTTEASTCNGNHFNDWVYYDFDFKCNAFNAFTLKTGNKDVLLDGIQGTSGQCTQPVYPAAIEAGYIDCSPPIVTTDDPSDAPSIIPSSEPSMVPSAKPSLAPSPFPSIFCESEYDETLTVEINTDNWPYETSWRIEDPTGRVIYSRALGSYTDRGTLYTDSVPNLCKELRYSFIISDSFDDGLGSNGNYQVKFGDILLFSGGGDFGSKETVPFKLTLPSSSPSEGPSLSPSDKFSPSTMPSMVPSTKKGKKEWRQERVANDPNFKSAKANAAKKANVQTTARISPDNKAAKAPKPSKASKLFTKSSKAQKDELGIGR